MRSIRSNVLLKILLNTFCHSSFSHEHDVLSYLSEWKKKLMLITLQVKYVRNYAMAHPEVFSEEIAATRGCNQTGKRLIMMNFHQICKAGESYF